VRAAAGLYALEHNTDRLLDDHKRAQKLARDLSAFTDLTVSTPDTNMVFVNVAKDIASAFSEHLAQHGIGVTSAYGATRQRWVTHLDISDEALETALAVVHDFFGTR